MDQEQPLRRLLVVSSAKPSTMQGKSLVSLGPDFADIHVNSSEIVEDWDNPHPVAVLLQPVWDETRGRLGLVVGRRVKGPGSGRYALPGGFMKKRETARAAALREFAEESGYGAQPSVMGEEGSAVVLTERYTAGGQLLIFVQHHLRLMAEDMADLKDTDEMADWTTYYGPLVGEGPRELAFPLHTEIADRWLARHQGRDTPDQLHLFPQR